LFIPRLWVGTLLFRCYLSVSSPFIRILFRLFPLLKVPCWKYPRSVQNGSFWGCRQSSWRVPDRATDTLLKGWWCLVADMEPVGSVDNSEDRNRIAGLASIGSGPAISFSETRPATMPDSDHEPFEATTDHHLGSSKAITAKIHRDPHRINHATSTQVRSLSTDRLQPHTHLQRVAPCIQPDRSGGGRC
jgi:hypothetical protein